MKQKTIYGIGMMVATAVSTLSSARAGNIINWVPDKYAGLSTPATLHGQVNISGATLFEAFFSVPASTNDFIDADGNGVAGKFGSWPPKQLAAPYTNPTNTLWLVNYRGSGSVNGLGDLLDYAACGTLPPSSVPSTAYVNRFHYIAPVGTPSPEPILDVSIAVMDVPLEWATVAGDPNSAYWHLCPTDSGYGYNPKPTSTGFPFTIGKFYLEKLSRDCDGNGTDEVVFNTTGHDAHTIYNYPTAWVPIAIISNRGTGRTNATVTELQHLWVTGRLPSGENLVAATRTPFSGTRTGSMNCLGVDASWARGDNIGDATTGTNWFQLSPVGRATNAEGSGEMESGVQNFRLAIGYTGLAGSARAVGDLGAGNYEILDIKFNDRNDVHGNVGSQYIRPTIASCLHDVLDNNIPNNGYQIGGPETFLTVGDINETNPVSPVYMKNQAAADYLKNIQQSILNFVNVPNDPTNDGMPAEYLATKFFLMAGEDALPITHCPTTFVAQATPPFNLALQTFESTQTDLGTGGDTPAFGSANKAGKVPQRWLNPNGQVYNYSDGSGTLAANTDYCYCSGGGSARISQGLKLGTRNKVQGDFNNDKVRDLNDVDGMVAAYFNPRGWAGACVVDAAPGADPGNQQVNTVIPEVIGDFNGDGDFTKEDLRYFMDGLGIDVNGHANRKLAAAAIDNAILTHAPAVDQDGSPTTPTQWIPWADTRANLITPPATQCGNPIHNLPASVNDAVHPFLKTGKPYKPGDFRGDVAGKTPLPGAAPVGWDGAIDAQDINYVYANFGTWGNLDQAAHIDLSADMNGDLVVDQQDVDELVKVILVTDYGDANLDGVVDCADRDIVQAHLGQHGGWAEGDFDGNGTIDSNDLTIWQNHANCQCTATLGVWASVRTHGNGLGELSILLDPAATGNAVVSETRRDGIQKITVQVTSAGVVSLTGTIAAVNAATSVATPATSQSVINNGGGNYTVVAQWTPGLPDKACYRIDLAGLVSCTIQGDSDCLVRGLAGNVNGDGQTNLIDMVLTKSKNTQPVAPDNVRFDVNVDGSINLIDMAVVKSLNNNSATCP